MNRLSAAGDRKFGERRQGLLGGGIRQRIELRPSLVRIALGFLPGVGKRIVAVEPVGQSASPRRPVGKFITMWVGVFDASDRTLRYVDAGHGYALLVRPDGSMDPLAEGEGMPVGVNDDASYQAATVRVDPGSSPC